MLYILLFLKERKMNLNGMRKIVLNKRNKLVVMPYLFSLTEIAQMGPTLLISELLERLNIQEDQVAISLNTMWRWKKNYLKKRDTPDQNIFEPSSPDKNISYHFAEPFPLETKSNSSSIKIL